LNRRTGIIVAYVAAAIAGPTAFWFLGRSGSMGLDMFTLTFSILPLSAVTLTIAASRSQFLTPTSLELGVALSWVAALVSFALVDSFLNRRHFRAGVDSSAILMATAGAGWLLLAALVVKGPRTGGRPMVARAAYGIGLVALAGQSFRLSRGLYLATRVTGSTGIEGVIAWAQRHLWIGIGCIVALAVGTVLSLRSGRARDPRVA
jgi:hypothetical protein